MIINSVCQYKMKTLLAFFVLIVLTIPAISQIDHDYNPNDRVPSSNDTIAKSEIPQAVLNAVTRDFDKTDPMSWSKFPYALKEYGWVYDVGASDIPLNRFEVELKTRDGGELWAIYSAKGELIETKEVLINTVVPRYIQEALANSKYKDWQIVGTKEIIKYYHDHDLSKVEQHFRLTVEKNNVRRSISFNYKSDRDKK